MQTLHDIYTAQCITGGREKHLAHVCDYVNHHTNIKDGYTLEFGVAGGITMSIISKRFKGRPVHGFDTFEGLPKTWDIDPEKYPKGKYTRNGVPPKVSENVTLVKGRFEDTLPKWKQGKNKPVRFMHIDCDIYEGAKTVLYALNHLIVPGTVIAFDELANFATGTTGKLLEHEWRALNEWSLKYSRQWSVISRSDAYQAAIVITK